MNNRCNIPPQYFSCLNSLQSHTHGPVPQSTLTKMQCCLSTANPARVSSLPSVTCPECRLPVQFLRGWAGSVSHYSYQRQLTHDGIKGHGNLQLSLRDLLWVAWVWGVRNTQEDGE